MHGIMMRNMHEYVTYTYMHILSYADFYCIYVQCMKPLWMYRQAVPMRPHHWAKRFAFLLGSESPSSSSPWILDGQRGNAWSSCPKSLWPGLYWIALESQAEPMTPSSLQASTSETLKELDDWIKMNFNRTGTTFLITRFTSL